MIVEPDSPITVRAGVNAFTRFFANVVRHTGIRSFSVELNTHYSKPRSGSTLWRIFFTLEWIEMSGLGQRLRAYRKNRGLTLNELAAESGVSTSYLSQIERGEKETVSADVLFAIATALGTTMRALYKPPEGSDETQITIEIPEPLRVFYTERGKKLGMTEADLTMLAGIRYRNKQPRTQEDWEYLYLSIKRTIES